MKIQCDVCNKDEASVFCFADEAALCAACDHRVHHANKLAGKHQRFSLIQPSSKHFPLCDICQERRAFLFCQEDRAILCRECDVPIHRTNEHTQKHRRFLLTGVKLSATSALYSSPLPLTNPGCDSVPSENSIHKPISVQATNPNPPPPPPTVATTTEGGSSTSSISEYLMEMLPGWRVEDFLDSSPASLSFSKNVDEVLPIWDGDLESNMSSFSSPENVGIWVPQAQPAPHSEYPSSNIVFGSQIGSKESKEATNNKSSRKWRDDGCFAVPQISPPSNTASKRSRTFW